MRRPQRMDRRQERRGQAPAFKRFQMRRNQDDVLILAATVAIDNTAHPTR